LIQLSHYFGYGIKARNTFFSVITFFKIFTGIYAGAGAL